MLGGDITVSSRLARARPSFCRCPTIRPCETAELSRRGGGASAVSGSGLVLVVDDDPASAHIIGSHLAREGYRLIYASDGHAALDSRVWSGPISSRSIF